MTKCTTYFKFTLNVYVRKQYTMHNFLHKPTTLQQNPGNTKSRDPVIEHIIGDNLR
jgi:hypothetical protein